MFRIGFAIRRPLFSKTMTTNGVSNGVRISTSASPQGDLNNTSAARAQVFIDGDESYASHSLAIPATEDDATIRQDYRPFLMNDEVTKSDWISTLELNTALQMVDTEILSKGAERLKILVLYGSMRERYAYSSYTHTMSSP
ncbi:hypothetical protein P154DRAFT_78867 [Amniculicola lignicola CBS 123094]|uniref:Uncharacterized protein n=1 Tax=Amniculicola lignicola CBS 123094 TaxID=1392246 RepID=A0A6A5WWY5_9PLEO|nr:hypothetical protein P154DRAFT_78867 [Amniculicola lignicola CBS 123094]